jgi:small subunit ribosomal protein S9
MFHGVGRRKCSVSRVWMKAGTGLFVVNGKELNNFFSTEASRSLVKTPLSLVEKTSAFDVQVNVFGGGITGQAHATRLGLARALLNFDESSKKVLKDAGFLKVDSRKKERKKPGQKKARKKFQFVKR